MLKKDFNNTKYDPVKEKIKSLLDEGNYKEDVRNLTLSSNVSPLAFLEIYSLENIFPKDLTLVEWKGVFDHLEKSRKKAPGLISGAINNAEISNDAGSQWQKYKKELKKKNFSEDSIDNVEQSSHQILQQLSDNTLEKDPIKGLVVGSVQSGKTANMIGLMSMAADFGFNTFIVFSGMIDSLRIQTENRMFEDLNLQSNLTWKKLSNPSLKSRNPELQWQNIYLNANSKDRYFTVALKNISRMNDLKRWLYSDENKTKQLKVLIIDDEADQASINTNKNDEDERTAINNTMLEIVEGFEGKRLGAVNYISYTATPYANALNEVGGLFPKDFVFSLPLSEDYIGPREIFGLQEPEASPKLHIVRTISNRDVEITQDIYDNNFSNTPESMKEAITWFFITASIYRIYNYKSPVSMLVHTSHRIDHHQSIHTSIRNFLINIQKNQDAFIKYAEKIYTRETIDFRKEDFITAMSEYSTTDKIRDYPPFDQIEQQMRRVLNEKGEDYVSHIPFNEDGTLRYHEGFHIAIDNSGTKVDDQEVRLIYPEEQKTNLAPMFIVIGGNTLSRGLTLEGLTTSYFLRNTLQADTLFQMGRWFGYRKGYELLPRVWLNSVARERFQYISQINEELIETIEEMSIKGQRPNELGIKVKNSPDNQLLKITSANKMQDAGELELDFSGINKQTIIFTDDSEKLQENLDLTLNFLRNLNLNNEKDNSKGSLFVWADIEYKNVKEFLSKFNFSKRDMFFSQMKIFLEWYDRLNEENTQPFGNWSIILSTINKGDPDDKKLVKGTVADYKNISIYDINSVKFNPVSRTQLSDNHDGDKTVSIGALRSPAHMLADLDNCVSFKGTPTQKEVRDARKEAGLGMVPQLILYIIDKNSSTNKGSKTRKDLNFSTDVVGMNLYIPGDTTNKNLAKYLSVKVDNE